MFLHLSVILFTEGGCLADTPQADSPWADTPLPRQTPQIDPPDTPGIPLGRPQADPLGRSQRPTPGQTPWADPPGRWLLQRMVHILLECILGRHPLGRHPPGRHPHPQADTPGRPPGKHPRQMTTAADGTHPTGMHSC